jgi:hypothetical protein
MLPAYFEEEARERMSGMNELYAGVGIARVFDETNAQKSGHDDSRV